MSAPTTALPFDGLTVIVTGDVDGFTRDSANAAIARLGGKPVGSVSGRTGLVIIGEGAGVSKMAKARTHKLNVIDGPAFIDLVAAVDSGTWDGQGVGEPVDVYEKRTDPEPEPEPDPSTAIPFDQRHLVGRASNFTKVPTATGSKIVGHSRLNCLKCGHRWLQRLADDNETCPVGDGTTTAAYTGPWEDLDVTAVAPLVVDHTKPPVPAGARAAAQAALARITSNPASTTTPAAAADEDDWGTDDVPVDPYDTFDPYEPAQPAASTGTEHPGGDW